jgi:hypothetical protein
MCFPSPGHRKSTMSNQAPDPIPKFFQNGSLQFCSRSSWEPEWEMCFPSPGHKKSTMSSQAPDPTPNFSKISLCCSVRAQVGDLSGKCASLPRAIKKQQCPVRLLTLPPTFPKWSFAVLFGFRLGAWVENVLPFPGPWKIDNVQSGPGPCPELSFAYLSRFKFRV